MLLLLEECWKRVQIELCERVGTATYEAWLKGLRPVLLERGKIYLEAESKLAADRVRALFCTTLAEVLSKDFGTDLKIEIQAREEHRFDALEVSPQRPVIDDGNRTASLVLQSLLPTNRTRADQAFVGAERLEFGGDVATSRLVPGNLYVFHGPAGVGKTFLLQWWQRQLPRRSMWFDLPKLLRIFQRVNQDKRVGDLHDELCSDLPLVIDELHRISRKPALQSFLQGVLRVRENHSSPTVLSSRWHPKDVRDLDASLSSSLLAGFVAAIERPGPLGRLRYLRALEGKPSRNGRAPQIEELAQKVVGSYPELRAAWASSRGHTLPPRYLELIDPGRVFQRVRDRVAERFDVLADDLVGKGQGRKLSRARKIMALMCQQQGLSGGEIGRFLGRTRAAVSYMLLSLQGELDKSPELRLEVEELT
ncbi:MAG: chromosomal replication initiation ATPase DnaA [Planctomycetota bacterium]|jgi:chromosomal replication initiation ATPase DnaA